jgi:hypothetical protein
MGRKGVPISNFVPPVCPQRTLSETQRRASLAASPSIVVPWSGKTIRKIAVLVYCAWTSVEARIQLTDAGDGERQ